MLVIAMFAVGMNFPLYFDVPTWRYIVFGFCFIAAQRPADGASNWSRAIT